MLSLKTYNKEPITEPTKESIMLTIKTKVRGNIEKKFVGIEEDRKIKWLQNKVHIAWGICCPVLSCSLVSDSCDTMDCSVPGSSVHGDSSGKNTGVGCHAFLQEIFPTQKSNRVFHIAGSPAGGIFLVLSTVTYRDYMISWAIVLLPVCSFVQANFKLLEQY